MKERNISRGDIRRILNGDFDPLNFSEPRFKGKIEDLEKSEKEGGFNKKRRLNRDSFYPKYELKDILRNLKFQRLDEEFFYDKIKEPTIQKNDRTRLVLPNEATKTQLTELITPPNNMPINTPSVSQDVVKTSALPQNINPNTGLTHVEEGLLSNEEKAMRLRQRGMTA